LATPQQSTEALEQLDEDLLWTFNDGDFDEMVRLFTAFPSLVAESFPTRGGSILKYAVQCRRLEMTTWLLNNGFDPNPTDTTTEPLSLAIDNELCDFVELLLLKGADPNFGRPMIAALNVKHEDLALHFAKMLMAHGCKINTIYDLYGDEANGFTALDFASKRPVLADYLRSQGGLTAKDVRAGKVSTSPSVSSPDPRTPSSPTSPEDEVIAYFDKEIGPPSKKSLIQIIPTGNPIAIHTIAPDERRKHLTLFTNGLSSEPMTVPTGSEDYRYAEIYMELPGDWKIREVKDMQWAWPLHWLRKMAQYPHNGDTWLGAPVTLIAEEEPPKSLYKGCPFSALFLFADRSFKRTDGNTVQLYRMIPLYASERAYELKHGLKKFMQAMDKADVPWQIDMTRKPFA
jgi:hypothetical protein